ncbi:endonuclease/exonuclease/phosphatase family protein [Streptosporangiaceae bacterium NEAU-GS5]|nr:endonuclease/exonuclease/phosphatase family protein [Streptosporangiaceae bacterium NEAU-GS5]
MTESAPSAPPAPSVRLHAAALAAGLLLFIDAVRVFLPSLITLYGRAGETPAEQLGLFAVVWFLLPFAAVPFGRRARWLRLGAAALLVVTHLALQATDGGLSQLYLAAAGVSTGLVFLYGSAQVMPRAAVPAGLLGGIGLSGLLYLLIDYQDAVWQDGVTAWVPAIVVGALFLWLVWKAQTPGDPASGSAWFLAGPAFYLAGTYLGPGALIRQDSPYGWPAAIWVADLALALGVLVAAALITLFGRLPAGAWRTVVLVTCAAISVLAVLLRVDPGIVLAIALITAVIPAAEGPSARPGLGVLGGFAVFLVATFVYYAAYDVNLGFSNLAISVAVLALITAVGVPSNTSEGGGRFRAPWPVIAGVVLVPALLAALTWRPEPAETKVNGAQFTLIAYNIRMGFGLKGTLDLDRVAAWARAQHPDVVLLSEVDRGWLLNGGHDDLARIAKGLGMRFYFAPAADPLWGDALLTNLPVKAISSRPLGAYDYPTGAQAQAAVLDVGGHEVGIVNTHLQAPAGQAREAAALAHWLSCGTSPGDASLDPGENPAPCAARPVILAGDLNTTHADPQMNELLRYGLTDPLVALGDPPTSPADDPTERIDHVLVTAGVSVIHAEAPRVTYSDHLPVVARLEIRG